MLKTTAVLLCLCAALHLSQALELIFAGNVSSTIHIGSNQDWSYRSVSVGAWAIPAISLGVYYNSVSAGKTKYSAQGDIIWGAASVAPYECPIVWLAFWSAMVDVNASTGGNFRTADVSQASSFIASSYYALVERDATGKDVAVQLLDEAPFGILGPAWKLLDANGQGDIKWATFGASQVGKPWALNITFVLSNVVGVLNVAGAVVSPKSLETIIEISGWPYKDPSNTLSLILGVATGSTSSNDVTLISGTGQNQVYFSVAQTAVINGSPSDITVSRFVEGDIDLHFNGNIKDQLTSKYGNNWSAKLVNITFPAGASSIVYDPTTGAGAPVAAPYNSAGLVVINFTILVLFVLITLL